MLETLPNAPADYEGRSRASLMKYRPIETDPSMSIEEKLPYMLEWWDEGIQLLKGIEWDPVFIDEYLRQHQQPFRYCTSILFNLKELLIF